MCYSGYIFCASSTVSTAHLIRSSLESECSRSLVPVLMMSDLGAVTEAFVMIDFAWLRVEQQMYFDLIFGLNSHVIGQGDGCCYRTGSALQHCVVLFA